MKISSVVSLGEVQKLIPYKCLPFENALKLAFQKISQNKVVSTWMDAWDIEDLQPDIEKFIEVPKKGCLIDRSGSMSKQRKKLLSTVFGVLEEIEDITLLIGLGT